MNALIFQFFKSFQQQPVVIETIFGSYTPEELSTIIVTLTGCFSVLVFCLTIVIFLNLMSSSIKETQKLSIPSEVIENSKPS
jgi:hypothetical protein